MTWTDSTERTISYLRVSVTDRCNYLCSYCAPPEGWDASPRGEMLTFEEIYEIVRVMAWRGVKRVRFTGGEPLLRKSLPELAARIGALTEIEEMALTTNGHLLERYAKPLFDAGVRRLNVSLDTFNHDDFKQITRGGDLARVLRGIEHAQRVGFEEIQLNAVLSAELEQSPATWRALCEEAWRRGLTPRWIEMMPIGGLSSPEVHANSVRNAIHERFELTPTAPSTLKRGPARYDRVVGGEWTGARVGFISPMSDPHFCALCNRARLTARGGLRACLANDDEVSLKDPLRAGLTGPALHPFIDDALNGKRPEHLMNRGSPPLSVMTGLGG